MSVNTASPVASITLPAQTFGVEIELAVEAESKTRLALRAAGLNLDTWGIVKDSSIDAPSGMIGREIVSPVLTFEDGCPTDADTVCALVEALALSGAVATKTCSVHIHLGAAGLGGVRGVIALAHILCQLEEDDFIFSRLGVSALRQAKYCRPMRQGLHKVLAALAVAQSPDERLIMSLSQSWFAGGHAVDAKSHGKYHDSRYRGCNLYSFFLRKTVELRYFEATTDARVMRLYLQFAQSLADAARAYGQPAHDERIQGLRALLSEIGRARNAKKMNIVDEIMAIMDSDVREPAWTAPVPCVIVEGRDDGSDWLEIRRITSADIENLDDMRQTLAGEFVEPGQYGEYDTTVDVRLRAMRRDAKGELECVWQGEATARAGGPPADSPLRAYAEFLGVLEEGGMWGASAHALFESQYRVNFPRLCLCLASDFSSYMDGEADLIDTADEVSHTLSTEAMTGLYEVERQTIAPILDRAAEAVAALRDTGNGRFEPAAWPRKLTKFMRAWAEYAADEALDCLRD